MRWSVTDVIADLRRMVNHSRVSRLKTQDQTNEHTYTVYLLLRLKYHPTPAER
jgi:hypothetical protein